MKVILTKNIKESKTTKKPILAVFQVGNVGASTRYIQNKKKDCEEADINFEWYYYPEEITTEELVCEIKDIAPHVDDLIVQMPLPDHIDEAAIKLAIDSKRDVNGCPLAYCAKEMN